MEEPGEQCTVVFALIATEPAIVFVCVRGGLVIPPPFPPPPRLADSVTIYAKTTVHCSPDSFMPNMLPLKLAA
jgi:hypothetical protein